MWRKNRRKVENSECYGVDLNRNFDKAFGTASSKNPCAEDFRGEEAFSEPESAAIRFCSMIFFTLNLNETYLSNKKLPEQSNVGIILKTCRARIWSEG